MGTLINCTDERLAKGRIFDCRSALMDAQYGPTQYAKGHIPGAIYADLNHELCGQIQPGVTGRHPLPTKKDFLQQVRRWGINNDDLIVTYDDDNGAFAARLWWMLRWLGHDDVFVLDGGFKQWTEKNLPVSVDTYSAATSDFSLKPALTKVVSAPYLLPWDGLLLDARDPIRFRGESEPVDPIAGHIPGAANAPFANNMNQGTFKTPTQLREIYHAAARQDVACYCGSGVTATHTILALIHAGFDEPHLYPGSWSEWITDSKHPIA